MMAFSGKRLNENLPKADAAKIELYSVLFDKNGNKRGVNAITEVGARKAHEC
jgi:hypothetical protein